MLPSSSRSHQRVYSIRLPAGYVLASLVFAAISYFAGKAILYQYGWRIAFMTGVIPVFLALWIRGNLHESPEFEKTKAKGNIEKALSSPCSGVPSCGLPASLCLHDRPVLTDYSVYGFLPKILTLDGRGFDTTTYSLIYGFALFLSFLGYNSTAGSQIRRAARF